MTKEDAMKYDESQKRRMDNYAVTEYAKKQGREQGIKEGIEEGIKEGEFKKAIVIAKEMKKDKMPVAQISKFTGLSVEEIEAL